MTIGKRVLNMVTVPVIGAAIVGLTASPAAAEEKTKSPKDNGVRCSIDGPAVGQEEDYVFYPVGETVAVMNAKGEGRMLECLGDGTWKDVTTRVHVPVKLPSGTFQQTP